MAGFRIEREAIFSLMLTILNTIFYYYCLRINPISLFMMFYSHFIGTLSFISRDMVVFYGGVVDEGRSQLLLSPPPLLLPSDPPQITLHAHSFLILWL